MPIEVERKFAVRPDTEQRLAALGGQRLGSRSLLDRYFDTDDLRLTSADLWLRSREGRWQLKSPVGAGPHAGGTTRYRETTSEAEILALLRPVLSAIEGGLDRLAETGHLREFATIRTQRISYRLPQGLLVDLDLADFGHQVGEIEVEVGTEDEVPAAQARIEEMARSLGLDGEEVLPGKMHIFLQKFRPLHFQKLLDARVL
ncbi:thiamine-triphosphatase [Hypanus sabinus]|uniref:thiamine-triphosphatase n=1 Tax=Hypanus sabinus TaxID=79690 RepID=UPI0028C3A493|nr:thiamine-triphosphatase [Hypanus sabinus]